MGSSNDFFSMKSKDVEVIPWYTADAVSCKGSSRKQTSLRIEPKKTVFVGGLHGMMSASLLRKMMKDLFGPVEYVVIDTDKNRYPIGSGRVRFSENEGYLKAIETEFVEVKVSNFTRKNEMFTVTLGAKIHKEDPNRSICRGEDLSI